MAASHTAYLFEAEERKRLPEDLMEKWMTPKGKKAGRPLS